MKSREIKVRVAFEGVVVAKVPALLSDDDARVLAEKLVLARILATTTNPDAPEDSAFEDYEQACSPLARRTTEEDWDATSAENVVGSWHVMN